jgi:hypothetical protein
MARNNVYARMYEMQAREAEEERAQEQRAAARRWSENGSSSSASMSSGAMSQPVASANGYHHNQPSPSHQLGDAPERQQSGASSHHQGAPGVTDDDEEQMGARPGPWDSLGDHEPSLAVPAASVLPAMYPLAEEASNSKDYGDEDGTRSPTNSRVSANASTRHSSQ